MKDNKFSKLKDIFNKSMFATAVIASLSALTFLVAPVLDDPKGARETLENAHLKPIEVGGGTWFGNTGDFWRTKFKAVTENNDTISGHVSKNITRKPSITIYEPSVHK